MAGAVKCTFFILQLSWREQLPPLFCMTAIYIAAAKSNLPFYFAAVMARFVMQLLMAQLSWREQCTFFILHAVNLPSLFCSCHDESNLPSLYCICHGRFTFFILQLSWREQYLFYFAVVMANVPLFCSCHGENNLPSLLQLHDYLLYFASVMGAIPSLPVMAGAIYLLYFAAVI